MLNRNVLSSGVRPCSAGRGVAVSVTRGALSAVSGVENSSARPGVATPGESAAVGSCAMSSAPSGRRPSAVTLAKAPS